MHEDEFLKLIKDVMLKQYSKRSIEKIESKIKKQLLEQSKNEIISSIIEYIAINNNLYELKKIGCFRYSKNKKSIIKELVNILLFLKKELSLSEEDEEYLNTVLEFEDIYNYNMKLQVKLNYELKSMTKSCILGKIQCSFLPTICTCIEHEILQHEANSQNIFHSMDTQKSKSELNDFSIVEKIDALSYIV